jgi:hypothetical protein
VFGRMVRNGIRRDVERKQLCIPETKEKQNLHQVAGMSTVYNPTLLLQVLDEIVRALRWNMGEIRSHVQPVTCTHWHPTLVMISEL